MSSKLNTVIAVAGIDIGKNSFHVIGLDKRGAIVLRQARSHRNASIEDEAGARMRSP
jgi:hypothetical protein